MARPENDPTHSSSEDEEDNGSSEEEVSESESEPERTQQDTRPSASKPVRTSTAAAAPESSSSSEEEESESEPDSPPPKKPDSTVKPTASKPMETSTPKPATKPRSKPITLASPGKSGKRSEKENLESAESKRAKKKAIADIGVEKVDTTELKKGIKKESNAEGTKKANSDDTKKQLFQRLWSEEDEIVILEGMIDYISKKKADPFNDLNAFYDFIKKSLHIDVSYSQLSTKVRRLRKKYVNNDAKKDNKGKERTLSKAHEQACYNLSKKIWGGEGMSVGVESSKSNGTAKKNRSQRKSDVVVSPKVNEVDIGKEVAPMDIEGNVELSGPVVGGVSIGLLDTRDEFVKNGWKLVAGPEKIDWEKKSKKVMIEEVEAYVKRIELTHQKAKLVLEAMKSVEE